MKWSTLENCRSTDCTVHEGTVDELAAYIKQERGSTKDGPAICGAVFRGNRRALSNVESVHFLMFDFDDVQVSRPSEALGFLRDYTLIAHSSYSHGMPGSTGMRFRVFVPLLRPVNAEEYSVLWGHVFRELEYKPDAACKDASRLNFLRRERHPDATKAPFFHYHTAQLLDPDAMQVDALVETERMRTEERKQRQAELTRWRESNSGSEHGWIDGALQYISPSEYHTWRDVGMALKRAGEEEGLSRAFAIWDAWSSGSDKYDQRTAQKIWDSFRGAGPSGAVTLGTVWHLAALGGWSPPVAEAVKISEDDLWGEDWGNPVKPPTVKKTLKSDSDHYLCEHALERYGFATSRVCWDGNAWQVYDDGVGVFDTSDNVVYRAVHELHGSPIEMPPKLDKNGVEKIETKYLNAKHSLCTAVEAKSRIMATRSDFHDARARGLAFSDGFFCSVRGEILPHSPSHRATVSMGIAFPAHSDAPVWEQTLRETLSADDAQTLEEYLGICLLGRATEFQRALFMTGHGSNGKSTIVDAATRCFPDESICHVSPHHLASQRAEYHLMEIRGRLINVVSEVSDRELRDASSYKSLVSGDPTSGRPPFGQVCRFRPVAGHVFVCNRLPSTSDSSDGFWRRAIVINFERQFTGQSVDPTRPMRLAAERSGITARLIAAGLNAIERGTIAISTTATESAREWRIASTPVLAFLIEIAPDMFGRIAFGDLYKKYKNWAEENGRGVMNSNNFAQELAAQRLTKIRSNGTYYDFSEFKKANGIEDADEAPF